MLIKAVAELARRDPGRHDRLQLIIIGGPSGSNAEWSQTLGPLAIDHGIADMVDFRPHSPRSELFRWYCVSDVVAVPSYNESFGLVALEAQACGRPVVATDVGGLRHTVRDDYSGLLVKGHDEGRWADALAGLLDDRRADQNGELTRPRTRRRSAGTTPPQPRCRRIEWHCWLLPVERPGSVDVAKQVPSVRSWFRAAVITAHQL